MRPAAFARNLLRVQNEQLFDVAGRAQSPYQLNTLFAAAPVRAFAATNVVAFVFRRSLYLSSTGQLPAALALDFGDGRSYQPGTWNVPLNTTYSAPGLKRVRVRCTYATGASY